MARLVFPFTLHVDAGSVERKSTRRVEDTAELTATLEDLLDLSRENIERLAEQVLAGDEVRVSGITVYGTQD